MAGINIGMSTRVCQPNSSYKDCTKSLQKGRAELAGPYGAQIEPLRVLLAHLADSAVLE